LICIFGITTIFAQNDFQIIPGIRAGAITSRISETQLKRIYGSKNVRSTRVGLGEGETVSGTVIFPNNSKRKIEIVWKNKKSKRNPEFILLTGNSSIWKTTEGISLGTSLKTLERINGKAFTLAGFAWDYGGTVYSWDKGKLARSFGDESQKVTLRLGSDSFKKISEKEYESIIGDNGFSSENKAMQKLNPVVYQMIVRFP
jgi:hypothetical protein